MNRKRRYNEYTSEAGGEREVSPLERMARKRIVNNENGPKQ